MNSRWRFHLKMTPSRYSEHILSKVGDAGNDLFLDVGLTRYDQELFELTSKKRSSVRVARARGSKLNEWNSRITL